RNGKRSKIPLQVDGTAAKSNDPKTWTDFETALQTYQDRKLDGTMFALTAPWVGIDLDECVDRQSGAVAPWAKGIILLLNSYAEVSPSGTGVHIIATGALPSGGRKKGDVEMYQEKRFFCFTGRRVDSTPASVKNRGAEIRKLHSKVFGTNGTGTRKADG